MIDTEEETLVPIKGIPRSFTKKMAAMERLQLAKDSYIYWWFKSLQASDEYRMCCNLGGNKGELVETYSNFGDVAGHFDKWWSIRGQYLFTEQERPKKVSKISKYEELERDSFNNETLILKIPLTLRKQTVTRRIGKILKDVYEGREVDIYKASTAKVVRIKNKIRMETIKRLLKILELRKRYPKDTLVQIGQRAGILLEVGIKLEKEDADNMLYNRRMTIAVSRYLSQANNLIYNVERGVFPSITPYKKEDASDD
jgi:hypothetical protein